MKVTSFFNRHIYKFISFILIICVVAQVYKIKKDNNISKETIWFTLGVTVLSITLCVLKEIKIKKQIKSNNKNDKKENIDDYGGIDNHIENAVDSGNEKNMYDINDIDDYSDIDNYIENTVDSGNNIDIDDINDIIDNFDDYEIR